MTLADLLTDLAACMCAEFDPDDTFCFCGLLSGDSATIDVGACGPECGMAWVRLVSAYPATTSGEVDTTGCGTFLGADIEVGVVRCVAVQDNGLPTPEQIEEEDALTQIDDMQRMLKVLKCCPSLMDADVTFNPYFPMGPAGGTLGGIWLVSVLV